MRVLHFLGKVSRNYSSGVASHVFDLATFQSKAGHDVVIVSYLRKDDENDEYLDNYEGIKVFNLYGKSGHDISICPRLYRLVQRFKPDIVHYHTLPIITFLSHVINKKYKIINTFHVIDTGNVHERIWRYFVDGIIGVSASCLQFHNQTGDKYRNSIWKVIYPGINLSKFRSTPGKVDYETLRLIMVCRIDKMKNLDHGVLITKLLNETYKIKTVFTIVGNGEYEKDLKQFIKANECESYINWVGFTREPYQHLADSHLCLVLSGWEAFSLAALEAMACGVPVVSYRIKGGFMDWFKDGECGVVSKENTIQSVAEVVSDLYANRERINQLSESARRLADTYDMNIKTEEVVDFYREILNQN